MNFEMNNVRKDADIYNGKLRKNSPVVEIFSDMINGKDLSRFGKKADVAVGYIKDLGARADNGDFNAVAELNTLRRFVVEAPVMEQIKALSIFGSYSNVGFDESIEREVYAHSGEHARIQAETGDVPFPTIVKETYPVAPITISGGYAVDYRRVAVGDMSKENEGMEQVKTSIYNQAVKYVVDKVHESIKNASGIKYDLEMAGLTKTAVDGILAKIRRWGKPTVLADYALLSEFIPWAGYSATINSNTVFGISDDIINELAQNGSLSAYNGAILSEIVNPYDIYSVNEDGDNFETLLPVGVGFIVPAGAKSPIATWTKGGLTSFTGNDVKSGKVLSRFDLSVAADVAKGQEYKIGVICDTNL